ncbi:MAG: 50S ribosomal protein L3 [Syntrophales bacterium]|nr:50S ribosomal protein L3 [Syntrophales bacterium]MDD5643775.1 50S ribosomal protein L3 [Syntrophales bacterium]
MPGGIIGKKLGMTRIFDPDGLAVAVTVIEAGPCFVSQVKSGAKEGYEALQLGFERRTLGKVNKPLRGHFEKHGSKSSFRYLREFRLDAPGEYETGQEITVEQFAIGDKVDVIGTSKGHGFTGTVKRWNFAVGPRTHGSMSHRAPGSIGCSAYPSRVVKGKKLPGQMGNVRVTTKNLEVVDVRPEENLLLIRGAVPGPRQGLVLIRKAG